MVGFVIWGTFAVASAASLTVRRPWTEILARRRNSPEVASLPVFRKANAMITAGWTAFFALASVLSLVVPPWGAWMFTMAVPLIARGSFWFGPKYAARVLTRAGA
jgi:hypothetical protein